MSVIQLAQWINPAVVADRSYPHDVQQSVMNALEVFGGGHLTHDGASQPACNTCPLEDAKRWSILISRTQRQQQLPSLQHFSTMLIASSNAFKSFVRWGEAEADARAFPATSRRLVKAAQ